MINASEFNNNYITIIILFSCTILYACSWCWSGSEYLLHLGRQATCVGAGAAGMRLWAARRCGYGAGMAASYMEGYLRVVLPSLHAAARQYSARHGVRLGARLHLLLPRSLHCAPDLQEYGPRLEACGSQEVRRDVAGVRDRVYQHQVYRVRARDGSPRYALAECATPLLTLHLVLQRRALYERVLGAFWPSVVLAEFRSSLAAVLAADPATRGKVSLIPFDDSDPAQPLADLLVSAVDELEAELRASEGTEET